MNNVAVSNNMLHVGDPVGTLAYIDKYGTIALVVAEVTHVLYYHADKQFKGQGEMPVELVQDGRTIIHRTLVKLSEHNENTLVAHHYGQSGAKI